MERKKDIWCLLGFHKWETREAHMLYPTDGDIKKYKVISPCVKCGRIRFINLKNSTNHDTNTETLNEDKPHTDALLQKSDTYKREETLTNIQKGDTK